MPTRSKKARAYTLESLDEHARRAVRHAEKSILDRQKAVAESHAAYLFDGIDLVPVKDVLGHGRWESWCKAALGYSKSKVEKRMRFARELGHLTKSVKITDLPRQNTAWELINAPPEVRSVYQARIEKGERLKAADIKRAVAEHKGETAEEAPSKAAGAPTAAPNGHLGERALTLAARFQEAKEQENVSELVALIRDGGASLFADATDALNNRKSQTLQVSNTNADADKIDDVVVDGDDLVIAEAAEPVTAEGEPANVPASIEVEPVASSKPHRDQRGRRGKTSKMFGAERLAELALKNAEELRGLAGR